jgi:hypothetical protein
MNRSNDRLGADKRTMNLKNPSKTMEVVLIATTVSSVVFSPFNEAQASGC